MTRHPRHRWLLPLALLLAAPSPAAGGGPRRAGPRVLKRLSVAQRTAAPSFDGVDVPALMDRGRMLYIGGGLLAEQETLYLLRLRDKRTITVRVPLARHLARAGFLLPGQHPAHRHYRIEALLFYDRSGQEAAVEVVNARAGKPQRHFLFYWDLARDRITEATLVARTSSGASFASLKRIGYDHRRRAFYYVRDVRGRSSGQPRAITIVGFFRGKPRVLSQFHTRRPIHRQAYLDAERQRALLVEYAEAGGGDGSPPRGHLVDLRDGKVRSFAVPLTAYGAVFLPGGRWLLVYSSQTGELWQIDTAPATPRTTRRISVGRLGHALGQLGDGRLVLVRNAGLQLIDGRLIDRGRLRRGRFVPIKRIYRGFSHVQGSLVAPAEVVVKNGDLLHFVVP